MIRENNKKIKRKQMDANKWGEQKEYIATCNSDLIKGMIKIRLHICELKKYCPREGE